MGTSQLLAFNEERQLHVDIMRAIARDLHDLPIVLKGGTALVLCYGSDRFSEDLDFDAPKKFNIAGRIERVLSQKVKAHGVRIVKDTDTVQRLKVHYTGITSERLLKIETSLRRSASEEETTVIDGIRTYSVQALIKQKINAFAHRTAARDLYDLAFLVHQYGEYFGESSILELASLTADLDAVEQRFQEAFEEAEILDAEDLIGLVCQISEFVKQSSSKYM